MCLVADAVACLLRGRTVVTQAVGLDDEAEVGPVEIDLEAIDPRPRQGPGKAGPPREWQEAPLELRVGERERAPVEELPQDRDAWGAAEPRQCCAQRLRINEVTL